MLIKSFEIHLTKRYFFPKIFHKAHLKFGKKGAQSVLPKTAKKLECCLLCVGENTENISFFSHRKKIQK